MKQTPIRVNADTLGDLISLRNEGVVGGLHAWCYYSSCDKGAVPLDLDALARERGLNYDWKRVKPVCTLCGHRDRNVGLSVCWTHTAGATSNIGTPPFDARTLGGVDDMIRDDLAFGLFAICKNTTCDKYWVPARLDLYDLIRRFGRDRLKADVLVTCTLCRHAGRDHTQTTIAVGMKDEKGQWDKAQRYCR